MDTRALGTELLGMPASERLGDDSRCRCGFSTWEDLRRSCSAADSSLAEASATGVASRHESESVTISEGTDCPSRRSQ